MLDKTLIVSMLASSAMTLAVVGPALAADKSDRAREAIAAAEAKVHTAETLGATTDSPRDAAQARASLASAREDFESGHKDLAIQEAIQASALADTAIGMSQQHKNADIAAARDDQRATVDGARNQIAAAQNQAAAAQDQAVAAQRQAAEANARADAAQQSAAASAADAQAARDQAALAATQTPPAPQVTTTVTTHHGSSTHHYYARTKVTPPAATSASPVNTDQVTTTTKVTPQ